MTILPLLAEIDWVKTLELLGTVGAGGIITVFLQGFFNRKKEQDDKEKVTFDTLLIALNERLKKTEDKLAELEIQLNNSEKEVLKLTVIIAEQEGKIRLYESKISEYNAKTKLQDLQLEKQEEQLRALKGYRQP